MRIYSNRKVENLEKLKSLTYSLKKTEIPLYLGAHIFFLLFWTRWSKVLLLCFQLFIDSALFCFMGPRSDFTHFLCWKRGLFKAAQTMISAEE